LLTIYHIIDTWVGVNQPLLVEDEVIQAVLGMNQKHILFPGTRIFQPPSLPQNFPLLPTSPPSYLPPTSLTSFFTHSISRTRESSWTWIAQSFWEMWDTRLEEGEELNVEETWRGEGKKRASSQMQKQEKKGKFPPFSTFFCSFFMCFFFCLRRRRCHHLLLSFFIFVWSEEGDDAIMPLLFLFLFFFVMNKVMTTSLL
jgi:hypothetical protein